MKKIINKTKSFTCKNWRDSLNIQHLFVLLKTFKICSLDKFHTGKSHAPWIRR